MASARLELLEGPFRREPYLTMIAEGAWSADQIAAELGEVVLGTVPARQQSTDIVLLDLPGMVAWDLAIARWIYQWATEHNVGTSFNLSAV